MPETNDKVWYRGNVWAPRTNPGLSTRTFSALCNGNVVPREQCSAEQVATEMIVRIGQLGWDADERKRKLLKVRGLGRKSYAEVYDWLCERGESDLIPPPKAKGIKPAPVPCCPHCGQRLPKHMRPDSLGTHLAPEGSGDDS